MKRNILKILSIVLALVMILSMVPMMAMAEEAHEHNDVCSCSADVVPASACSHTYVLREFTSYAKLNSTQHTVIVTSKGVCSICGATSETVSTRTSTQNHTMRTNTTNNTSTCTKCGYTKLLN